MSKLFIALRSKFFVFAGDSKILLLVVNGAGRENDTKQFWRWCICIISIIKKMVSQRTFFINVANAIIFITYSVKGQEYQYMGKYWCKHVLECSTKVIKSSLKWPKLLFDGEWLWEAIIIQNHHSWKESWSNKALPNIFCSKVLKQRSTTRVFSSAEKTVKICVKTTLSC